MQGTIIIQRKMAVFGSNDLSYLLEQVSDFLLALLKIDLRVIRNGQTGLFFLFGVNV